MYQQVTRSILTFSAIALTSAAIAFAQNSTTIVTPAKEPNSSWSFAQSGGSSKHTILVYTLDHPDRRQTCHVQSFTVEKLVCSRAIGAPRTYLPQQVLALVLPGDDELRRWWVVGLNAGLGASIWGTVVLAAACPVCAAATGVAALIFFGSAGATLLGDGQPDRVLYLAEGHSLNCKLRKAEF